MFDKLIEKIREALANDGSYEIRATLFDVAVALATIGKQPVAPPPYAPAYPARFKVYVNRDEYAQDSRDRVIFMLDGQAIEGVISAIKYLREKEGLGIREAKEIVDALPTIFTARDYYIAKS